MGGTTFWKEHLLEIRGVKAQTGGISLLKCRYFKKIRPEAMD
jgi:hypothetical protein